jgi:hypothetical protein
MNSTLFRGWGLLVQDVDLSCAVPTEKFECMTCNRTGMLGPSGRCGTCGSDAVISTAKLEASHV